ncbi:hypothetical protein PHYPSEUDO_009263 [Phytophthora pseudosyringae]|uniref:Uncharacterized protein n=1 Tax=Phytophthora pseudosyringae TaxID=221518 RepID=A0A8T1VD18_9STRA|nr:hypothetical protein PHYPSEUDO_009263 [Phytophthora pseudosyringae]
MATDVRAAVARAPEIIETLLDVVTPFLWTSVATDMGRSGELAACIVQKSLASRDGSRPTRPRSSPLCSALRGQGTAWTDANEREPRRSWRALMPPQIHRHNDKSRRTSNCIVTWRGGAWAEKTYLLILYPSRRDPSSTDFGIKCDEATGKDESNEHLCSWRPYLVRDLEDRRVALAE